MAGNKITEAFEYKTDIITSYDGHEQRIQTRQHPRHLLTFDYPSMNAMEAQWLRGLTRMKQSVIKYIPMWHNVFYLTEDYKYNPNETDIRLYIEPSALYDLMDCEAIEIFNKDDPRQEQNIVKVIHSFGKDSIRLKNPILVDLDKRNTFIYPLRKCSIQPMSGLQYIYSNGSNVSLSFEDLIEKSSLNMPSSIYVDEESEFRNKWNLPLSCDTREIFLFMPQWVEDSSVELSVEKAVNRLDTETGMFWYDLKNNKSYDVMTFNITLMNKAEIHNMIRFFKRMKGMARSFYVPTWVNDIELCEDIKQGKNFIYTNFNKLKTLYANNGRFKKLVIFTKDWQSYIVDVIAYLTETRTSENKQYGKIMLGRTIRQTIPYDNILMCSYLDIVRFDSDNLQLNYETNNVANVTLTMREVDE